MSKAAQINETNKQVIAVYEDVRTTIDAYGRHRVGKLRTCQAEIYETLGYTLLYSYGTLVAAFDPFTETVYDFLRYVYGYTATSAQHISKFYNDMKATSMCRYENLKN